MFRDDEEIDVIEKIAKYWIENATEKNPSTESNVNIILMKIEKMRIMVEKYNRSEVITEESIEKWSKETRFTDEDIDTTEELAKYWLENAPKEKPSSPLEPSTESYVRKILMKIDHRKLMMRRNICCTS